MRRLVLGWSEESADVEVGEIIKETASNYTMRVLGEVRQADFEKFMVNYMKGKGTKEIQLGSSIIKLTEVQEGA